MYYYIKLNLKKIQIRGKANKFLKKYFNNASLGTIYKLIRKDVKVNGKRANESTLLANGDELTLYISDETAAGLRKEKRRVKVKKQFKIAYEDDDLLIVEKPFGLLTHGDRTEKKNHLANQVIDYLIEKGDYNPRTETTFVPAPANRLDRNTGGLVLAAKTAAALRALNAYIRGRSIRKYYSCLVLGCPAPPEGELAGNLHKDGARNVAELREQAGPDAKPVLLRYRVMQRGRRTSLLEVELCTGRPHQIRVQLAGIGCPVAGDPKYGDRALNRALDLRWQALFASRIEFGIPADDPVLGGLAGRTVELPPPIDRCP